MTKRPLDTAKQPWVSFPYLVSWWDMEQFSAEKLYEIKEHLEGINRILDTLLLETGQNAADALDAPYDLDAFQHNDLASHLETIREHCDDLDLHIAKQCVDEFYETLDSGEFSIKSARAFSEEIGNTVRRELQAVLFFHLSSSRAEFYNKCELFGPEVSAKFPELGYDIEEAGNCFAMGRATACVFHLMRVMERGVQTIGNIMGIKFPESKEWGEILRLVKEKIDEQTQIRPLHGKDPEIVQWNQLHAYLTAVKNGWRNRVMHPYDKYTLDEAEDLIGHVKAFMKTLAKLP